MDNVRRWAPDGQRSGRVVSRPVSSAFRAPLSLRATSAQPRTSYGSSTAPAAPPDRLQPLPSLNVQPAWHGPGTDHLEMDAEAAVLNPQPGPNQATSDPAGLVREAPETPPLASNDLLPESAIPVPDIADTMPAAASMPPVTGADSAPVEAAFPAAAADAATEEDSDAADTFALDSDLPQLPEGYSYLGRRRVRAC